MAVTAVTKPMTQEQIQQAINELEARLVVPAIPVISDGQDFEDAGLALKEIKADIKRYETRRDEILGPLKQAVKSAQDLFKPTLDRLAERETAIKKAMVDYNRMLERIRIEEQARLDEQHRKEEERAARKAAKLIDQGKVEKAEAALANVTPPTIVQVDRPKVAGIVERTTWSAEVEDLQAFAKWAVEQNQAEGWLKPNQAALNSYAVGMKEHGVGRIPGVRIFSTKGIAAGQGRR